MANPNSFFTALHTSKPFFLRHHHVEKDQVRLFLADGFKRFFSVGRGKKFNAFVLQLFQALQDQRAQMGFIVDNQNLHRVH